MNNPEVTTVIHDAARFWLEEMNVDGFRLDAIKHLVEDGQIQENSNSTHDWLEEFYTFYKAVDPRRLYRRRSMERRYSSKWSITPARK